MAFNGFAAEWILCLGQYHRIDDLIPANLRGDERSVFLQFLIDKLHDPAVIECFDPFFVCHLRDPSAQIAGFWRFLPFLPGAPPPSGGVTFPSRMDCATRGFAISFLTLARVAALVSFLFLVFIEFPRRPAREFQDRTQLSLFFYTDSMEQVGRS
jgi:hypothetical protein